MKLIFIILIWIITGLTVNGQPDLSPVMSNPIKGRQYIIDYDRSNKVPVTVYYIVTESKLGDYGRYYFHQNFYTDSAREEDYSYSGYDRGHMFSSASSDSYESNFESFDMVNIIPQTSSLNRGLWKQTEIFERWNCYGYCYVICGILEKSTKRINGILVPRSFYKAIYVPKGNKMIGFILTQTDTGKLVDYVVTIDEIETRLNKDLFHKLPISEQFRLESTVNLMDWEF